MAVSDRVARGRARFRTRLVTYAGLGGYAAALVAGTAAGGNSGSVAGAAVIGGAAMFWLGRRSSLESASAEAYAWATATAQANATATALAGVQVNLNMSDGSLQLSDATGLHRRVVHLDQSPAAVPIASSSAPGVEPVKPALQIDSAAPGAASTFWNHLREAGLDRGSEGATMPARVGGTPVPLSWPARQDSPSDGGSVAG